MLLTEYFGRQIFVGFNALVDGHIQAAKHDCYQSENRNSDQIAETNRETEMCKDEAHPPVLVPAIISKYSQGFEPSAPALIMICFRI